MSARQVTLKTHKTAIAQIMGRIFAGGVVLAAAGPTWAASCVWNPATGNWGTAGNWSCGIVPTGPAADSAAIAVGKTVTINTAQSIFTLNNAGSINIDAFLLTLQGGGSTTNTGTINVGAGPIPNNAALQMSQDINNTGGVINISADSALNQFSDAITGGTINTTGTGKVVVFSNGSNVLSGVTLNGTLDMTTSGNARERIGNGITLNGATNVANGGILTLDSTISAGGNQTIGGTGTINLNDAGARLSIEGSGTTTLGSGVVVRGQGNVGQALFSGGNNTLINNGRISADVSAGTLSLSPPASGGSSSIVNNSLMDARNGGTLLISTNIDNSAGVINAQAGSTVVQSGITITGGTISSSGTGAFQATSNAGNFLNGVTLAGTIDMTSIGNSRERIINSATLTGAINIGNGGILSLDSANSTGNNVAVSGTGIINLNDSGARLAIDGTGTTTLSSGITVRGQGNIGQAINTGGNNVLTNNGLISADVSGGTLSISSPASGGASSFVNNGTLQAINGATLLLSTNITSNTGSQIIAGAGSSVVQSGVTINGVVNVNAGGTGVFTATSNGANILNAVNLTGTLDLASIGNSRERIINGATINGAVNISNGGILSLDSASTSGGNQTILGTATINLNDSGARLAIDGTGTTTLSSGITVRGQGNIGQAINTGGNNVLTNNGLISADVSGGTLSISSPASGGASSFVNNGTLQAINGATLLLSTNITSNTGSQIIAGAGSSVVQNGVTINGVVNVNAGGTGVFTATSNGANILNAVNLTGTLDLASIGNSRERIINGATINGAVNISNGGILSLDSASTSGGNQTILGTATINLNDSGARLAVEGTGTTTLGSGITVRGQGNIGTAIITGGNNVLTNNGLISADVSAGTLSLSPPASGGSSSVVNNSLMDARNGGTLLISTNIDNSAGVINAQAGSTVVQSGITITGGTISSSGTGAVQATSNAGNFLNGVTLAGTIDMTSIGNSRERIINSATLTGAINIGNGGILSLDSANSTGNNVAVSGTGVINLNSGWLAIDGTGTSALGAGVTVRGQGLIGQAVNSGGNNVLSNNGLILADGGTLTISAPASGGGSSLTGTGTLQTNGGTLAVSTGSASTQGKLIMGAAGSALSLAQNLTITNDYTNAQSGSGNSFNSRAGVSGIGQILAGGNAAQAITGANVTNGATTNATLTINNVRVGAATTFNYQVANTGTTGPSLRGAVQTNVNGANLTDARLSGAGVTASNYNAGAPGSNTGNLGVTFTAASAGALAPLSGQVLNLTSNFSNIADQKLNIVLGAGAAAYNAAVGNTTNVSVTNQRVGAAPGTGAFLNVTNTAASGSFTEVLNASFGATTGGVTTNGASITGGLGVGGIAGGLNNNTTMQVFVDNTTAGAKSGTVALNYVTNGAGTSGLASAPANGGVPQVVNVSGNVYQVAQPTALPGSVNLGNFRAGTTQTQTVTLTNTNIAPGFQEGLNATIVGTTLQGAGSGVLNNVAAGSSGSLQIGVTGVAGVNTGTVQVQLATNGTGTSGLGNLNLGSVQTINVSGTGYLLAASNVIAPISIVAHTGDGGGSLSQALTIINGTAGTANLFQEGLNSSFGGFTGLGGNTITPTLSGSITNQVSGQTNNTAMQVTVSTATAGVLNGTVTVNQASNGATTSGLGITSLGSQSVAVNGSVIVGVFNLAAPTVNNAQPISFGAVRQGSSVASQALSISNTAPVSAFTEALNGSVVSAASPFTAAGSFNGLAAGSPANTSISVGLNTATAGHQSGNVVLGFVSDGTAIAGNGTTTTLSNQSVAVTGDVYRLANPTLNTTVVTIAARVGDSLVGTNRNISITNTSPDAYTEGLKVNVTGQSGNVAGNGSIANLAAQGTSNGAIQVALASTAVAGSTTGAVNLGFISNGAGTTGATDTAAQTASGSVNITSRVYTAAGSNVQSSVNFGIVHVGDVVTQQGVSVQNSASLTALNDTLNAQITASSGAFTNNGGSVSGLTASGAANTTALKVGLNTSTAGVYSGTATVASQSHNADMADLGLGNQTVTLNAQVNKFANAVFDKLSGAGTLTRSGNIFTLDFGTVLQGSSALNAHIDVQNLVNGGPADLLNGHLSITDGNDFTSLLNGATVGFSPLAADASSGDLLTLLLSTATLGLHTDSILLDWFGTNGSGYQSAGTVYTLNVVGNIIAQGTTVPEPGSLLLMTLALAGLGVARRRKTA